MRALLGIVLVTVVYCAGCATERKRAHEFPSNKYRVGECKIPAKEQAALLNSVRALLTCLGSAGNDGCGLRLNVFEGARKGDVRKYFSGDVIDRIWSVGGRSGEDVLVEFPRLNGGAGGVLVFNVSGGLFLPYGATLQMP